MTWRTATVSAVRAESPTARTLVLDVPHWPGHLAGQHLDVRLTAPDGYTAVRPYSIASAPDGERVELTVEEVPDGEVSPYLVRELSPGDLLEVRGPLGGWFVWRPEQQEPVTLVAGGSGLVPLMAMVRARVAGGSTAPFRLVCSTRAPSAALYADEVAARAADGAVELTQVWTRAAPPGWAGRVGRLDAATLAAGAWPPERGPTTYVCGPTGFVEAAADLLAGQGHDPARIRTERFG